MYEVQKIEDIPIQASLVDGYLIGITLFKGDKLYHSVFRKDFPMGDMLKSIAKHKELAIEQLETDTATDY
jgi:hypothetical protein